MPASPKIFFRADMSNILCCFCERSFGLFHEGGCGLQLTKLRGISEKREKELNKLNIFTAEDLVRFYPRAYLDLTHRVRLSSCYHNDMPLVACRVASPPQAVYTGRRAFVKAWCDQDGELFSAVWFNAPYVKTKLKEG